MGGERNEKEGNNTGRCVKREIKCLQEQVVAEKERDWRQQQVVETDASRSPSVATTKRRNIKTTESEKCKEIFPTEGTFPQIFWPRDFFGVSKKFSQVSIPQVFHRSRALKFS